MENKKDLRKRHRLYFEFLSLLNDDPDFADIWQDRDDDFFEWVMSYEIDSDWEKDRCALN